jgi:ABC-type sugar transport system ATPase subunit
VPALLEVDGLGKSFPGVRALDDVSLDVGSGEVVALVGHNGSGKSTLVKILAGVHTADDGQVRLADGPDAGIHFIHQDLGLVSPLSTVENIDLVRPLGARGALPFPRRRERNRARELVARFGGTFDVDAPVSGLSPVERTIVAIARALDGWATSRNVLVLDEPTAALSEGEVRRLFDAVRVLVSAGAGVLLVSHRLDEVVEIADRVVVLRDGRVVARSSRGSFDQNALAGLIAGAHDEPELPPAREGTGAAVVLAARDLRSSQLQGLDLDLRDGEIVGITGLLGSGIEHVGAALVGALPGGSGHVEVEGTALAPLNPRTAVRAGMAFAPADRRRLGAVVTMTARENLTLPLLRPLRGRLGQLRSRLERREAGDWMATVDVRPSAATERPFSLFSGGNQQKLIIARWLRTRPRVLLLEEPTQGVDVGAQAAIHRLVVRAAAQGAAVLVSSTDAKELSTICHRVVVLHGGRPAVTLQGAEVSEQAIVRATLLDPHRTTTPTTEDSHEWDSHE